MRRCCFHVAALIPVAFLAIGPAQAGFRVCNHSSQRVDVAVGYPQPPFGWTSQGWWPLPVGQCATVLRGRLASRYYYLYATGTHGNVWQAPQGQNGGFFCTQTKPFLFHTRSPEKGGLFDCTGADTAVRQFFRVDTHGAASHIENLSN